MRASIYLNTFYLKLVCVSITHVLISLQLSQPGLKKGENKRKMVLVLFLIICKFKAQKTITLVTGMLIILCEVTSLSLMKETSYQILTSTLLFLTKLVNKKKKNTSFMYDKARARCSQVQTQLLFNWFNFFSQRQSCDFPTLFQSFLFYLHAWPRKLAKQNTVFHKTTGTVGSIIRFRNVNHTCRYTHTHKYSPLAM